MHTITKIISEAIVLALCGLALICSSCVHIATSGKKRMCRSENFNDRKLPVSMIVLHYTALSTYKESMERLSDTNCQGRVSAHYLIDRNGDTYQLVDESKRAWHAGIGKWREVTDINSASIGIELVNVGLTSDGKREEYPAAQMQALIALCKDIQRRHKIRFVLGHSDVAPSRKQDPGENFDWKRLAENGVGIWTDSFIESDEDLLKILTDIGYDTSVPDKAIVAFQRHFYPAGLNGDIDMTKKRAAAVRDVFFQKRPITCDAEGNP